VFAGRGRDGKPRAFFFFFFRFVIFVHPNTSVYNSINEVEPRLGTNIEVFSGSITLT
jgi:hypothetical protein